MEVRRYAPRSNTTICTTFQIDRSAKLSPPICMICKLPGNLRFGRNSKAMSANMILCLHCCAARPDYWNGTKLLYKARQPWKLNVEACLCSGLQMTGYAWINMQQPFSSNSMLETNGEGVYKMENDLARPQTTSSDDRRCNASPADT